MTEQTHPMDQIVVRPMRFDYDGVEDENPVWSRSCPEFSIFINGLAIHSPYFERFLGAVSRKVKDRLGDERLRRDVSKLIGQEAHHAHNFVAMNRFLARRYPAVGRLDRGAREYFETALERFSLRKQLGFVAGYETFTFLAGMIVLDAYEELMGDADPVVRALWVWHQVEEVEHGSVAFDTYRAVFGAHEWFRKWMLVYAFSYIGKETVKAYLHMCRVEGIWRSPRRAWKAVRFFLPFSLGLVRSALPALRRRYHPRAFLEARGGQNPMGVAWRRFYGRGGDAASLSDETMGQLMMGAPDAAA